MSTNLKLLSIEDLEMLLRIQHEKAEREAEVRGLAEEAVQEAERAAAARKAGEEAVSH
jgi:aspartate carbamoyltransferase catalytic subunit